MHELTVSPEKRLNELSREINTIYQTAIFEIGERLLEAKKLLPHGEFMPWVEKNCPFARSQAQCYMQVTRRRNEFDEAPTSLREAQRLLLERDNQITGTPVISQPEILPPQQFDFEVLIYAVSNAALQNFQTVDPRVAGRLRNACSQLVQTINAQLEKESNIHVLKRS